MTSYNVGIFLLKRLIALSPKLSQGWHIASSGSTFVVVSRSLTKEHVETFQFCSTASDGKRDIPAGYWRCTKTPWWGSMLGLLVEVELMGGKPLYSEDQLLKGLGK